MGIAVWKKIDYFNIASIVLIPTVKKSKGIILLQPMICVFLLPIPKIIYYSILPFIAGMYFGFEKSSRF